MSNEPNSDTEDYDFYYADLQVTITVSSDGINAFTNLTDNQRTALQQILYMGLSTFLYSLGLHSLDNHIKEVQDNEGRTRN